MFHVLLRRDGPEWDPSRRLEEQSDWEAHAAFTDGLVERGFIVLGGPLAATAPDGPTRRLSQTPDVA